MHLVVSVLVLHLLEKFAWAFSVGVVSEINLCPSHDEDALL